ncbi:unnamed protein product [Paramecium sonneborni]|uniref:Uncharacterized protein n=1 Tax=Paramecium sonneborni TaxID=65129 RepID=A0A8S1PBS8_9CILI|nr:unnamed protein product [Paramecium sonneborni]
MVLDKNEITTGTKFDKELQRYDSSEDLLNVVTPKLRSYLPYKIKQDNESVQVEKRR